MRTLPEISAIALVVCAGLVIASREDLSTPEITAVASPPADRSESANGERPHADRRIQTTGIPRGNGLVRIPDSRPGVLIITSASPAAPETSVRISQLDALVADAAAWQALAPLTIVSANTGAVARQPDRRTNRNDGKAEPSQTPEPSEIERTFFLHVTDGSLSDPRQYVAVHSRAIAEGKDVRVYLDRQRQVTSRLTRTAQQIIKTLEEGILPRANQEIGKWDDVDGDGKLSVLLTPWLEKLQGGRTSLKGFVRGSDFRPHYPRPFGNRSDVIYFNSELAADVNYLTLLAHEYWHILQCSYRLSIPESPLPMEADWINEGTAHLAEIRFGGGSENLEHRIVAWLNSPESAPLAVENYYSAGLWRDDGCRGATFLFFQWCEQQFGSELSLRLLTCPGTGERNLQQVTGLDFETLQTHWTVAMLEQARLAAESPQAAETETLFANAPVFRHVALDRLQIHAIESSGSSSEGNPSLELKLAPTATCYVRVVGGRWKIESEEDVSLRVTFVPDDSAQQFADSEPTGDSRLR